MRRPIAALIVPVVAAAVSLMGQTAAAQGRGNTHAPKPPVTHGASVVKPAPPTRPATAPAAHSAVKPSVAASAHPSNSTRSHEVRPATTKHVQAAAGSTRPVTVSAGARQRITALLPPGTNIDAAAAGFKNFGQFVAAVHVSRNLGIPFADLKARMTGPNPLSLGQAIQTLRPTANTDYELRRAEQAASADLRARTR